MKQRLDQLLVARGLADSRRKAQALIMSGAVLVDDRPVDKAGTLVSEKAAIRLRKEPSPYVGRGGEKIAAAFDHFQLSLEGIIALDVGASTGGFTDCMLQRGAQKVYAVDVGYNQLASKLRDDPRVVVMERTHAADLTRELFDPPPELAVIDVSFIGLRKILATVAGVLGDNRALVALVKPQFELGPEYVEKGGVVRSERDQRLAVELVEQHAAELGLRSQGSVASPLRGEKKGNQEYFVFLKGQPPL